MSKKHKKQKSQSQGASPGAERASAVTASGAATSREMREDEEPSAAYGTIPVLLIAALGLLLYGAVAYAFTNGGDLGSRESFPNLVYFPYKTHGDVEKANPLSPDDKILLEGRKAYELNCAPCHQSNGGGNRGNNVPPLAGSEWVVTPSPGRAIRVVLDSAKGPIPVKGDVYDNAGMVPWRGALSDEQIAAILSYVRTKNRFKQTEWGNNASMVSPQTVKKVRDETAAHAGEQWTEPELKQVPETE